MLTPRLEIILSRWIAASLSSVLFNRYSRTPYSNTLFLPAQVSTCQGLCSPPRDGTGWHPLSPCHVLKPKVKRTVLVFITSSWPHSLKCVYKPMGSALCVLHMLRDVPRFFKQMHFFPFSGLSSSPTLLWPFLDCFYVNKREGERTVLAG